MSDLKITHAGAVQTQDRQGPMNPFAPFGQAGSVWKNSSLGVAKPPLNQVFIAITIVENNSSFATLVAEDPDKFANTAAAAHDRTLVEGATSTEGELGVEVGTNDLLPAGLTIYGRWTEFSLNALSTVIAYIG